MFKICNEEINKFSILLPENSHKVIVEHAGVLQSYIEKQTGYKLPIVNKETENCFILRFVKDFDKNDGVHIKIDKKVLLEGRNPRSSAYAVYTFLEKYLGWRFLTGKCEICTKSEFDLSKDEYEFTSPFEYRLCLYALGYENEWYVKHKNNSLFAGDIDEKFGKGVYYAAGKEYESYRYGCHTYGVYLDPVKYFKDHPEYFMLDKDGTRKDTQPCLSNPEVFKIFLNGVRETLKNCPDAKFVCVAQNDVDDAVCHCPECEKNRELYQSPGANELIFANKIAREIKDEYPNVLVETLAYNYSTKPPVGLKAEPNVSVRFCLMAVCREHAITDPTCKYAGITRSYFDGWQKVCDNIYLWDYTANYKEYMLPLKNFNTLYRNTQYYTRFNIKGVMYQYIHNTDIGGLNEFWAYMQSKLAWNPKMSYAEYTDLMHEFLNLYYGKGGDYLYEYILLHATEPSTEYHYGPYVGFENYMPQLKEEDGKPFSDFFDRADSLFESAKTLATEEQKLRIEKAYLQVMWYKLDVYKEYAEKNNGEFRKAYNQLVKDLDAGLKKFGIDSASEGHFDLKELSMDEATSYGDN